MAGKHVAPFIGPRRRVTVQGRVVYDRKTHYFSIADLLRIVRALLRLPAPPTLDKLSFDSIYQYIMELLSAYARIVMRLLGGLSREGIRFARSVLATVVRFFCDAFDVSPARILSAIDELFDSIEPNDAEPK